MSKFVKAAIILLVLTVFIGAFQLSYIYSDSTEPPATETQQKNPEQLLSIVKEDEVKRGNNVKDYLLSNGEHIMAVYSGNVHYKDNEGKWQEIDVSLETVRDSKEKEYYEAKTPAGLPSMANNKSSRWGPIMLCRRDLSSSAAASRAASNISVPPPLPHEA